MRKIGLPIGRVRNSAAIMTGTKIPFYKMSGSGNDFILVDNRKKLVE
jgi:hypothetical protein